MSCNYTARSLVCEYEQHNNMVSPLCERFMTGFKVEEKEYDYVASLCCNAASLYRSIIYIIIIINIIEANRLTLCKCRGTARIR